MKKIRSISLSNHVDEALVQDSEIKGITISANISQILHEYFLKNKNLTGKKLRVKRV